MTLDTHSLASQREKGQKVLLFGRAVAVFMFYVDQEMFLVMVRMQGLKTRTVETSLCVLSDEI